MSFDLLSAIKNIAPILAGTFGTPLLGLAVKSLCTVIPDQSAAIQSAHSQDPVNGAINKLGDLLQSGAVSTDQIKQAELAHATTMAELGFKNAADIAKVYASNTADARKMAMVTRDETPKVLAAIAVVVMGVLIWYVATGKSPEQGLHDTFMVLVGAIITTYKDVYNYYFGSSSGSKSKDETISNLSS